MTLIDLKSNKESCPHPLGKLTSYITKDGSISLRSSYFRESFHSSHGAKTEALEKFIYPAELNRFLEIKKVNVLDVCLGLGYNSACLLEAITDTPIHLSWWGLEIDQRPLKNALKSRSFKESWSNTVLKILKSIDISGQWETTQSDGKIIWGDARQKLALIPKSTNFDLILHDAFSPRKCPQLWSEEFLYRLAEKLAPNGRLITYSTSAAIRGSLKRSGLLLHSIIPINEERSKWSSGTIGIRPIQEKNSYTHSSYSRALSKMEEEHLLTSAGIPYRDPSGYSNTEEILNWRELEQKNNDLESTSSWKKRWENT